jgi:glycosyltransferase involved in cell wall biosynthesis
MMKSTVYIDAACDFLYSSYYIYGLKQIFRRVRFSSKYFKSFQHNNAFVPFVIKDENGLHKFIVDFGDSYVIDENALNWCDVYGKININDEKSPLSNHPKVVSVGPGFGIRLYSKPKTWRLACVNFSKAWRRVANKRRFFADYYSQLNRQGMDYYQKSTSKKDYIFFAGALWKKEQETNRFRANYIRACKRLKGVEFEGGFAPRSRNDIDGFEDLTMERNVPMASYLLKLKESATVFNTPVILDCHGWKLGEFMAMGKAMVATPVKNRLPVPLVHGVNVHAVLGEEDEIFEALELLTSDDGYRQKIEDNIHAYYEAYVSPQKSIEILLQKAGVHCGE